MLKREASKDVRSTTGSNLRGIMLLAEESNLSEITIEKIQYHQMTDGDRWRIVMAQELIELRGGSSYVKGFNHDELDNLLDYVCTS